MKNYDNPMMFRSECDNLYKYSLSHSRTKDIFSLYLECMALYFLFGEYEFRKKAVYYKKKIMSFSC